MSGVIWLVGGNWMMDGLEKTELWMVVCWVGSGRLWEFGVTGEYERDMGLDWMTTQGCCSLRELGHERHRQV